MVVYENCFSGRRASCCATGRCGVAVMTKLPHSQMFCGGCLVVPECCGEEGAQPEGKALPLPLHLHSNCHPLVTGFWQVTERIRSQIEATEMSLLLRVSGLILIDTVRILTISKKFRVEQLIRCIKRNQFSVSRTMTTDACWIPWMYSDRPICNLAEPASRTKINNRSGWDAYCHRAKSSFHSCHNILFADNKWKNP